MNRAEILRKLLHLIALAIPFGIYHLPAMPARITLVAVFVLFFAGEIGRLHVGWMQRLFMPLFGPFLRSKEQTRFTGATFLILSGTLSSFLFPREVAFICLSFIILGDAAAALIGIPFGRIRWRSKSLEGTVACAITCMVFWYFFPVIPLRMAVPAALLTALLEFLPLRIDDNLAVPLLTGAFLRLWMG